MNTQKKNKKNDILYKHLSIFALIMAGVYIHIPFCASRCIYCGFYSTTALSLRKRYVDAVCLEMSLRKDFFSHLDTDKAHINTIYLGGGTPSQLPIELLERLFTCINNVYCSSNAPNNIVSPVADKHEAQEITIECNPDDITPEYAQAIGRLPINRVSIGVQTFSDERLRFLRRRHTQETVYKAIDLLRKNGINNISIDLIFGFSDETLRDWEDDVRKAVSLDVEHISAYSLTYEAHTPLYRLLQLKKIKEADEETSLRMYESLMDILSGAGYIHYEISNFCKPSFKAKHNSSYWQSEPYIGLGAAAHSYDLLSRQWNINDLHTYIKAIEQGKIPCEKELLNDDMRYNDMITTALRTSEGINIENLKQPYRDYLLIHAAPHIEQGIMQIIDNHIRISRKGIFISDSIMSDLIYV